MRVELIWVAKLSISSRTSDKINGRHHVTDQEVRDAVVGVRGLYGRWGQSPTTGERRAQIETFIRGRPAVVYIYPRTDPMEDAWNLGSVYFLD